MAASMATQAGTSSIDRVVTICVKTPVEQSKIARKVRIEGV
ncbi:hypothetical protein CSB92_2171 [Pseudomonas aeruginosa]|nr:Hypothetical protein SCV20265_6211 [Pseudomonas aeruginosa SCV20265]ARI05235.1 hypothetical protein Y880_05509 [Pseudomonas aeruginosa PAK]AVJ94790.1 hypothetical protein CSB97_4879 [Pseudomonas aeruginosa]EFQ42477.1 hypothetical protein PA39016_003370058 [Pseudomonas aeruginosa 39016]BAK93060.1 hypothetical protein NCGM2_6256 [Pseudomonas aeruginosa NCGM2.S1]GAJ54910.1 hypothetical protein RBRAMI_3802 [Pseudomonas aeruginosa RB]